MASARPGTTARPGPQPRVTPLISATITASSTGPIPGSAACLVCSGVPRNADAGPLRHPRLGGEQRAARSVSRVRLRQRNAASASVTPGAEDVGAGNRDAQRGEHRADVSRTSAVALIQRGRSERQEAPVSAEWEPRNGFLHLARGSKGELTRSAPLAIRNQGGQILVGSTTSRLRRIPTPTPASTAATAPPQSTSCRNCKPNSSSSLAVIPSSRTNRISRDRAACFPMSTRGRRSHDRTRHALSPALTGRAGRRIVVTLVCSIAPGRCFNERAARMRGRFGRG